MEATCKFSSDTFQDLKEKINGILHRFALAAEIVPLDHRRYVAGDYIHDGMRYPNYKYNPIDYLEVATSTTFATVPGQDRQKICDSPANISDCLPKNVYGRLPDSARGHPYRLSTDSDGALNLGRQTLDFCRQRTQVNIRLHLINGMFFKEYKSVLSSYVFLKENVDFVELYIKMCKLICNENFKLMFETLCPQKLPSFPFLLDAIRYFNSEYTPPSASRLTEEKVKRATIRIMKDRRHSDAAEEVGEKAKNYLRTNTAMTADVAITRAINEFEADLFGLKK